jgi:DNA-binding transcriptional LysR family regulator
MTPDQLITFATVAEHGNISRAAVALHLSQPAVSGQLRQLQDEFGEPLYQRDGRGVRLTAAGEQLVVYAARIRETFAQAHAYRNALRGMESGTLRIGASTTPASYLLPYLIAEFHRQYPEVTIHTVGGNTTEVVAALGSLDIAMIEGPVGSGLPPGTEVTPWREDEIVAIAPSGHPLAMAASDATLDALCASPLGLREEGSGVRQLVERACARAGVQMRVALEIAGVEGVKEAVRAGMGIGFVSAMSMRHEDGALRRVRISPEPLTRRFSILMPHGAAPSRVAARFYALCLESDVGK